MTDFVNVSGLDFKDISNEQRREYFFDNRTTICIYRPLWLHVSARGGHRLFDADGNCHYIPPKWIHITWKAKLGAPHFKI